ncbi:MAG: TonB-dependent receptor [Bacteroidota bacterium]
MRPIFYFSLLLFFPLSIFGQTLAGHIEDATKSPIVGAYIIHLQSDHHAHSNEFGNFFINGVKTGDTLQITHLGYETQYYEVSDLNQEINIELEETVFDLGQVVVGQNIKKVNIIASIDINTSPVNNAQEFLRKVPGLFIGQHAGGGKAEQIFLRGFDIDHGTDVSITVDGMPVNMVSHAHGQGYADMHFLIPETIENVDYGKGPYYASKGNFATAGYVDFKTKDKLEESQITIESGRFNLLRTSGLFKILDTERHHAYFASEYTITDGPFESSQNFSRLNFMGKYSVELNNRNRISFAASHFDSKWDASGQIPQRSVDDGSITRFGAIDDTEGGETSRTNFVFTFDRTIDEHTFIKNRFYYTLYDFELYSNFTFFLEDPINADQIRQKEDREMLGVESVWNKGIYTDNVSTLVRVGVGLRSDNVDDNELSRSRNRRQTLERLRFGDVDETNAYAFANVEFDFGDFLIQPGVRVDYFKFNYVSNLDSVFSRPTLSKTAFSPKLNIIYNLNDATQLFLKSGIGFHSNDARVVLERDNNNDILPPAYGVDLGGIFKPTRRLIANVALWYLFLEQEFVYVGDAGIVEPSGRSRRLGVDVGIRYQIADWLYFNGDVNYAYARSIDEPEGADRIPLAPITTATSGLIYRKKNINASLSFRYIQDRPANEDNSIVAEGYAITDLSASYSFKKMSIGFAIENLFDQDWNETQFATESRLRNETASVEEIHFTPGTPFFIKGILKYKF